MSRQNPKNNQENQDLTTIQYTSPDSQPQKARSVVARQEKRVTSSFYSGPLPMPSDLADYEKACPGAADRILKMAEQQASHRQSLEKITVQSQSRNSLLGIISGAVIGLASIGACAYIATQGYSVAGLGGVLVSISVLAGVFVYGKRINKEELKEKQKILDSIK